MAEMTLSEAMMVQRVKIYVEMDYKNAHSYLGFLKQTLDSNEYEQFLELALDAVIKKINSYEEK